MKNPYLLAWTLNFAVFGLVWAYIYFRFRLPFLSYCAVAVTCMPIQLSLHGYPFFLGDVIGIALLATSLLRSTSKFRGSNTFASSVIALCSVGLIAWPLVTTYLSVTYLNEIAQPSVVLFFLLRAAAQLGFFWWAANTGAAVPSVKPLLSIPAAFWLLFAGIGILHFSGVIDVDAFWYLNNDFKPSLLYPSAETLQQERYATSGFMGMDKPQLALWSSYGICIALWLFATESGAWALGTLMIVVLSVVIVLAIGSRQGLLGVILAIVCTGLFAGAKSMGRFRVLPVALGLIAMIPVGSFIWNGIDSERREWMLSQFEQLGNIASFDDLVRKRDESIPDLVRFIAEQPQRLYLGSGVGTESSDGQNAEGIRTYAEGEYLRVFWSGGLISLTSYLAILMILLRQSIKGLSGKAAFQQGEGALLFSITVVGMFFAFGQFHLFTTLRDNVPCNYLLVMVSGLLGGAIARSRSRSDILRVSGDAMVFHREVH